MVDLDRGLAGTQDALQRKQQKRVCPKCAVTRAKSAQQTWSLQEYELGHRCVILPWKSLQARTESSLKKPVAVPSATEATRSLVPDVLKGHLAGWPSHPLWAMMWSLLVQVQDGVVPACALVSARAVNALAWISALQQNSTLRACPCWRPRNRWHGPLCKASRL